MATPVSLPDHLRRRRFDLGHSQEEAAHAIGVAPDTLQKWEANDVLPAPGVLDAVESYLGVCFVRWTREIGRHLRTWRKVRGLDQLRAARRIGICLETVTKLERGRLNVAALDSRGRVFEAIATDRCQTTNTWEQLHLGATAARGDGGKPVPPTV